MPDYRQNQYGDYSDRRFGNDRYSERRSQYDEQRRAADRSASINRGASRYGRESENSSRYGQSSRNADRASSRVNSRYENQRSGTGSPYSRSRYDRENRTDDYAREGNRASASGQGRGYASVSARGAERVTIDERRGRSSYARERSAQADEARIARGGRAGAEAGAGRSQGSAGRAGRPSRSGRPSRAANASESRGGYNDFSRYLDTPRKSFNPALIAAPVLAVALIAFGIFQIVNPKTYDITVNGAVHTVERGTTIDTVLEAGYATPVAGNLLAVDGAVLEQGGGDRFSAVVNDGEPTNDGTTPLKKKTVVTISDGLDVMEPYKETTETIPFERVEDENYWNGSMHVYIPGSDGVRATRTGDYSGITVTEDTTPVVHNQWKIYDADTKGEKVIALTFDDGPWAGTTEDILDILKEHNAKATFFTVGYRIADYPDLIKRMANEGHQVCTHSWDHAQGSGEGVNLTFMSPEEQVEEIEMGIKAIEDVLGTQASRVIRAPGGNFYGDIIWNLQSHITAEIGWDVDTQDWRRPGADAIAEQILSAKAGNVILMHDGGGDRTQTVEALRMALPKLIEQGYTFVTVDELLAYGVPGMTDDSANADQEPAAAA